MSISYSQDFIGLYNYSFCRFLGKYGTNKQSENDFRATVIAIDL